MSALVTVLVGWEEFAWAAELHGVATKSPVLLHPGCVILSKLLGFSEPQFSHLEIMCTEKGDDNV